MPTAPAVPTFSGAVLCGGRSRRMGRDKALIRIDGVPMVVRVADALRAAGATDVFAVGRDPEALAELGLVTVADDRPGAGPVAGIATALAHACEDLVLVAGCDLLAPSPVAMAATVAALAGAREGGVAVPRDRGRRQ
ncbi:MAG: molybdenum cofactor guanylyltransferase, partial [Acidimicrobiales bacterium]